MKQKPQHQRLVKHMFLMGTTATLFEVIGIGLSWKYRQLWPAVLGFGSAITVAQKMTHTYYQQVSYMEVIGIGLSWKYRQLWPAVLGFGSAITVAQKMTHTYYQQVSYMCPNCQKQFKPSYRTWLLAPHTSQTRMLTCPNCGFKGYCTEIYDASMKL